MTRPRLEVAEIFRRFGRAWRAANAGHLSPAQRRVMRAVELCRTAELGGHVEQCADCAHIRIAYNSCRNRHCPKCQWRAAQAWLEAREAELLPVPYFHVVFTLSAGLGALVPGRPRRAAPAAPIALRRHHRMFLRRSRAGGTPVQAPTGPNNQAAG